MMRKQLDISVPSLATLLFAGALVVGLVAAVIVLTGRVVSLGAEVHRQSTLLAAAGGRGDAAQARASAQDAAMRIDAPNEGLAAAQFETRLSDILTRGGLNLKSIEVLSEGGEAAPDSLSVKVEASGSLLGVREALLAIEGGTPYFFVTEADFAPESESGDRVTLHLVVEAFMTGRSEP